MGVREWITHSCQTPQKAKEWVSCPKEWVWSAHHCSGCYLCTSYPLSSLSLCLLKNRYISSHSEPTFVIISEGHAGNLHLRFISIRVFWLTGSFLIFFKVMSDWNVTFGKLTVIFQFNQPYFNTLMWISSSLVDFSWSFYLLILHCQLSSFAKYAGLSGGSIFLWRSAHSLYPV